MPTYIENFTFVGTAEQLKLSLYVVFCAHAHRPVAAKLIPQVRSDTDRAAGMTLKGEQDPSCSS